MTLCSLTKNLFAKTVVWAGITTYSLLGVANATVNRTFACDPSNSPDIAYHVLEWKKDDGAWNQTKFSSCTSTECRQSLALEEASIYTLRAFAVTTSNVKSGMSNSLTYYEGAKLSGDVTPPAVTLLGINYVGDKATVSFRVSDASDWEGQCLDDIASGYLPKSGDQATHTLTTPFGVQRDVKYEFTDFAGNRALKTVTVHIPPEEFVAGSTPLVSGDAVGIASGVVTMNPSLSTWDYGVFRIPLKTSKDGGVIDLKYEAPSDIDVKVRLKDSSWGSQTYHLMLKKGQGLVVVPLGFPFEAVDGFDLDSLLDEVQLQVPSSGSGLKIDYLDVREAGTFASGRLETAYAGSVLAHNHPGFVADPSLVSVSEKMPEGLIVYMKFDSEANIWVNEAGLDAENVGAAWAPDGRHGGAAVFNRDGYLVIEDFESLFNSSYLPMTLAMRLSKPGNNDTNVFIDTSYDTMRTENRDGFALVSSGNNNLKIAFEKDGVWTSIDTGITLSSEKRTAVISIDPSGNYFAMQDGVMKNKGFLTGSIPFSPTHDSLWIGEKGDSTATSAATIEDLLIYDAALTPLEASKVSSRLGHGLDVREEGGADRMLSDLFVELKRGALRLPDGMLLYLPFSDDSLSEIASGSFITGTGGTWLPDGDRGVMQFSRDGTLEVLDFNSLFEGKYSPMTIAAVMSKPGYNDMNIMLDTSFDTFSTATQGGWSILNSGTNNLIFGYGGWTKMDSLCPLLTTPRAYVFSFDEEGLFQSMTNGAVKRTASLGSVPFNTAHDSLWIGGKGDGSVGYDGTIKELGIFEGALSLPQKVEISDRALGGGYLLDGMPQGLSLYGEYSSGGITGSLDLSRAAELEVSFTMNDLQITRLGSGGSVDVVVFDGQDLTKYAKYSIPRGSIVPGYNEFRYGVLNPTEVSDGFSFGISRHLKVDVSQDAVWGMDNPNYKKLDNLLIEFR